MAVVNMPVECLIPHPQNPRKDLGNLEELTASIKENGIYQNLTVIPVNEAVPGEEPKYMVVIGHRRLEAAKRAGLQEVPCAIVRGMTETRQLQTMLLENMQRSDLTVYEQAQGFQQLLDFGMDIEDISQQSGFSKSTIRRRLEIAKLDQNKLKELSSTRQLSLKEFDALAKIKNMEARNEAMEKIGTNDFALAVKRAVEKEKLDATMPVFLADMERLGIKKFPDTANKYSSKYRRIGNLDLYEYEVTKDKIPKKTAGVYYEASYPRNVEFYVWFVRDDGLLLGLTYIKEQDIYAWHKHSIQNARFVNVCCIPGGECDELYAVIERNGQYENVMLEKRNDNDVPEEQIYVDDGITVRGSDIKEVTGLTWLEGETVAILADGNALPQQKVEGGKVTLSEKHGYSVVHVGLPIDAVIKTLPIEFQMQDGSSISRKKRIGNLSVLFKNTRGGLYGLSEEKLDEIKWRDTEAYGQPTKLFTGKKKIVLPAAGWDETQQLIIKQDAPLPMTVLAIVPEIVPGG